MRVGLLGALFLGACGPDWTWAQGTATGGLFLGDDAPEASVLLSIDLAGESLRRFAARKDPVSFFAVTVSLEPPAAGCSPASAFVVDAEIDGLAATDGTVLVEGCDGDGFLAWWDPYPACADLGDCHLELPLRLGFTRIDGEPGEPWRAAWEAEAGFALVPGDGEDATVSMSIR